MLLKLHKAVIISAYLSFLLRHAANSRGYIKPLRFHQLKRTYIFLDIAHITGFVEFFPGNTFNHGNYFLYTFPASVTGLFVYMDFQPLAGFFQNHYIGRFNPLAPKPCVYALLKAFVKLKFHINLPGQVFDNVCNTFQLL